MDFDIMPLEIACHMISYIKSIHDIINWMIISKRFRYLAEFCIQEIYSDIVVRVPITNFIDFIALKKVNDNILLTNLDISNVNILTTMPKLYKATFYIGIIEDLDYFKSMIINILKYLNTPNILICGYYNRKKVAFVVQNNKFMFLGFETNSNSYSLLYNLIKEIQIHNLELILISLNSNYQALPDIANIHFKDMSLLSGNYAVISKTLKHFLRVTDFGLLDPSKPPSDNNPSISKYAQLIANAGIDKHRIKNEENLISDLFVIYNAYYQTEQLVEVASFFQSDLNIFNRLFNKNYSFREPSNFPYSFTKVSSIVLTVGLLDVENPAIYDIINFEIPNGYPEIDDYDAINNKLHNTIQIYNNLHRNIIPYYTTNATLKAWI
jgi:hypothetical protein